jgi:hypothetical protein
VYVRINYLDYSNWFITFVLAEEGSHWLSVSQRPRANKFELIDSLKPDPQWVERHFGFLGQIAYNKAQLQPNSSILCGPFSVFSQIFRLSNQDLNLKDLLNSIFSDNLEKNEEIVKHFFSQ